MWITAAAYAAGYVMGILVNFFIARAFVFRRSHLPAHAEFTAVFIIGLVAWGLTEAIGLSLVFYLKLHYLLAKAIAIPIVFIWNYFSRRKLIYHETRADEVPREDEIPAKPV